LTARGGHPKPTCIMRTGPSLASTNLYTAAKLGTLRDVPAEMLTEKTLTSVDEDTGYAPIHIVAIFGHLDQIPQGRLTREVISAPSQDKLNALHYAARSRHLAQVPKELLTPELLGDQTHTDWTPAHEIAAWGDIGLAPAASLTNEILTSEFTPTSFLESKAPAVPEPARSALRHSLPAASVVEMCIRNNTLGAIPPASLTPYVMHGVCCSGSATPMHIVAQTGQWDSVPANLVTEDVAFLEDGKGESPLHYAAKAGKLREVPATLFTQESVMYPDRAGNRVLHTAALAGHISQVPQEFLTRENLSSPQDPGWSNASGKTVYHFAAASGTLGDLPLEALKRSDLLLKDKSGATSLHDAATFRTLGKVPRGIVQAEDLSVVDRRGLSVEAVARGFGCQDQAWDLVGDYRGSPVVLLQSLPADPQAGLASSMSKSIDRIF
jgi:ankyrin repeat protein